MTTVYVTKYALTSGIQKIENCTWVEEYRAWERSGTWPRIFIFEGQAFLSCEEAVADAEKRRAKKFASLKKQIAKIEAMKFDMKDAAP